MRYRLSQGQIAPDWRTRSSTWVVAPDNSDLMGAFDGAWLRIARLCKVLDGVSAVPSYTIDTPFDAFMYNENYLKTCYLALSSSCPT